MATGNITTTTAITSAAPNINAQTENEILQLHGADHPGMVLVSAPLTGKNYLNWSHAINRSLRAKMKLGFIDCTLVKPDVSDAAFEKWTRVDSMVTTWILNSISKDIVEGFMYTKSSRTLWLDLEERYGNCNGHLLYQLQREITTLSQGNMSVVDYYTKLRKLWDELEVLMATPQCTCNRCICGMSKRVSDMALFTQLMQFLIGLGEFFDQVRNQLLVMDPIPSINRAYSMVQSVEKEISTLRNDRDWRSLSDARKIWSSKRHWIQRKSEATECS
ncbi:hypothetical protein Sango_1137500 [Sesamum angolense]|uniref:Retrotransposon Copia-like N-terminal domain-containing protein n=1 Tax=Sesamum angolense TaxID=2727404 RepID=A0AAE1WV68_9LAMI|nr:hypothetical protein Sango_1137500 [Sesamum angolense]